MSTPRARSTRSTPLARRASALSIRGRSARGGFTLTELLVAVGAVGLLTVGIGQIFKSVTKLTSSGQAVAELDAVARALEAQLRADFDAFNRLPPEQSFLVIRMREEGDLNRNGALEPNEGEIALYATPEDRDADRREGVAAYGSTNVGGVVTRSRAVSRRLDDMAFLALAPADEPYRSAQAVQTPGQAASAPTSRFARIYWGHALRPRLDPTPLQNTSTGQLLPARQYIPDGNFGDAPGAQMTLGYPGFTGTVLATGRNEFASRWLLARQPMLLFGGSAAGNSANSYDAPLGWDTEYAPYIRDLEGSRRIEQLGIGMMEPDAGSNPNYRIPTSGQSETGYPNPRYAFHGRVDVCAQDIDDVRRWLEGRAPVGSQGNRPPPYAGAFSAGSLFVDASMAPVANPELWQRQVFTNAQATIDQNLIGLRSAIAGTLARPQADDAPARIDRAPTANNALLPTFEAPEDGLMDLHAILASRCSSFEVAWSDGTRASQDIDFDADPNTIPDYRSGDLIWFDISVATINNQAERSLQRQWQAASEFNDARRRTSPPIPQLGVTPINAPGPQIEVANGNQGLYRGTNDPPVNLMMSIVPQGSGGVDGDYHVSLTGGAPVTTGSPVPNEVVSVWGFRLPTGDGGYGAPWPKPKFIRVRVILHDAQFRIPGGKQFEYVFALTPAQSL